MKKSMAEHNELGKIGEDKAIAYLKSKGYSILHRNWRSGKFEIDIIAENEEYLVVVEVKSRKDGYLLHPVESVGKSKMRNVILAAEKYIFAYDVQKETRFDVISVVVRPQGQFRIEHIEDAFLP